MKYFTPHVGDVVRASPPSRGAWIEIRMLWLLNLLSCPSPPSRGAWIEIIHSSA